MKRLLSSVLAVWISCLALSSQITAQGGCTFITFVIVNVEPCQYRIDYTNANECYPQLRVLISEGSFAGWAANTSNGWSAASISPTELLLTHTSGFIPIGTGSPLTFTLAPGSQPVFSLLWDYSCPPGEGCFAEFQLGGCQVIADGCIEGLVYMECSELPFINQDVLSDWTIDLLDDIGNVLHSEVTGSDGAYSFCDLPAGIYIVRVGGKPGWTSKVPPSGQSTIELGESGFEEQNFGMCPPCSCGLFSDMFIRTAGGVLSRSLSCGSATTTLTCPSPGESFVVTGLFHCAGDSCADVARLQWTLVGPFNTYSVPTTADPYFSITLLASYFTHSGLYTLKLNSQCGSLNCPCEIRFTVDCTDLCPCSSEDVDDFVTRVERGFAVLYPENSCTVCFTPLALDDCETVEWSLLSQAASTVGSSVGVRTFCYEFTEPVADQVIMEVTRKKDDLNNCDKQMRMQPVVPCHVPPGCDDPFMDNPDFNLGAQAGGFNSGGMSRGWSAASGEPVVVEGAPGSADGWTIRMSGNLDTAGVLSRSELICLEKGVPAMCSTTVKSSKSNSSDRVSAGTLKFYLGSKEVFNFNLNDCQSPDCYELASIRLPVLDSNVWVEVQVPYDLSTWDVVSDCAEGYGILVRPYIFVTNDFGSNQGGPDTYANAELDNVCFSRSIVSVKDLDPGADFSIYPNPNTGEFTIELSVSARQGMIMQIISLTGQVVFEKEAVAGNKIQTIEAEDLAEGIYFLQMRSHGRVLAVNKFAKQ